MYKQTRRQATALLFTLDTKLLMCKLVVKYTPEVLLPNQSTLKEHIDVEPPKYIFNEKLCWSVPLIVLQDMYKFLCQLNI
jgi:hypothetical protein